MLRNVGAVLAGLVVGSICNMLVLQGSLVLYPMPEGVTYADQEAFKAYVAGLPGTAFLIVMLAHLAQAFVGGWLAARLGTRAPLVLAMIVAGLTAVGGVVNLVQLPGPAWMWVELPLYFAAGWGAARLVRR